MPPFVYSFQKMYSVFVFGGVGKGGDGGTKGLTKYLLSGGRSVGGDVVLPYEISESILEVPILKYDQRYHSATTSWDSSIHDSFFLNQVRCTDSRFFYKRVVYKIVLLDWPKP